MAKKKEEQLIITISKHPSYEKHKVIMHLDLDRTIKFNKFEEVEVTQEELEAIGLHRWLIVKEKKDVSESIS